MTKCSSSNQEFWACQCLCFIKIILCWFSCRILSANAGKCTVSGPILTSTRAGLVIGHTEHFPGGPTHLRGRQSNIFHFLAITQGQQAASLCFAHCFVSCIDSVNPPITMRYRQRHASPQLLPRLLFPHFHSRFITNRLALWWVMRAKGGEESSWIGQVLDRNSQRRQASKYPNLCACHDCRIRKHFLIKR